MSDIILFSIGLLSGGFIGFFIAVLMADKEIKKYYDLSYFYHKELEHEIGKNKIIDLFGRYN